MRLGSGAAASAVFPASATSNARHVSLMLTPFLPFTRQSPPSCLPLPPDHQVVQLEVCSLRRYARWQVRTDVPGEEGGCLLLRLPHLKYLPALGRHTGPVGDEPFRLLEQRLEDGHHAVVALLGL